MKYRIFIIVSLLSLLFSGCSPPAEQVDVESDITAVNGIANDTRKAADNITLQSGTAADIQAAIDAVYADGGGTVFIPEGDFNLGGNVLIPDQVRLIGAGIGKTILRTQGSSMVIQAQGNNIGISGFSLISENYDGADGIRINNCIDFRVDHLYVEGYVGMGVYVNGIDSRGVVDHNEIKMKITDTAGYGVGVYREDFWEEDMKLGSAEAIFIEDNVFVNARHAVMANNGGHYVFRHNLVQQGVVSHQVDTHGPYWGSNEGTRAVEVYDNLIENPADSASLEAISLRGGGGVIFNNTIRGYEYGVLLVIESGQDLSSYPVYHQVHDLWIWNNSHYGSTEVVVANWDMADVYIQEGRDYFLYAKPDYTPYPYPHPLTLVTLHRVR